MTPGEPQSAVDYDDRTTAAVQTVLIEIGQILGSFKGKFAIVGGAVPWLLLGKTDDMPHVGTMDVGRKFDSVEGFGPTCVRRFVEDTDVLRDRTPEQWQQDAFGQVDAWLRSLGLRG